MALASMKASLTSRKFILASLVVILTVPVASYAFILLGIITPREPVLYWITMLAATVVVIISLYFNQLATNNLTPNRFAAIITDLCIGASFTGAALQYASKQDLFDNSITRELIGQFGSTPYDVNLNCLVLLFFGACLAQLLISFINRRIYSVGESKSALWHLSSLFCGIIPFMGYIVVLAFGEAQ